MLTPVSANSFDALGHDGGDEDGAAAKYAIDNNPGTFWHTSYYLALGNLKKGTGLILDMGKQVRLSQVVVQFGASCCAERPRLKIGNDNNLVPATSSTFAEVARAPPARTGATTFQRDQRRRARYAC